jgi:hypothetical protein
VAHADGYDAAQEVEKPVPVHIAKVLPLAMVEDQRVLVVGCNAVEKILFMLANNLIFGHKSVLHGMV